MTHRRLAVFALCSLTALASLGQEPADSDNAPKSTPQPNGGCWDLPCGCAGGDPVDLLPYFIPSYSGWQTAKKVQTMKGGGTNYMRMFQYASGKYELIKCPDGTCTETFNAGSGGVFVTSEIGPTVLNSSSKKFLGSGLYFLPASICRNARTFRPCHGGEQFINPTSCLPTGQQNPARCALYLSRIDFAPGWDYGASVGVVDSIIKVDELDNHEIEKYWYGLHKGLLRWEHWSAQGQLLDWGQQTSEIPNSPIPHNTCPQP